jgi:hypothetical protein
VIGLGDSANLVAGWAIHPAAAITIDGRASDLSALVLISPNPEGFGYVLGHAVTSLTTRVPLLFMAGERDNASKDAIQSVRRLVDRSPLNKVEFFPSSLHGYKLLRLEPKLTSALFRFLEVSLKNRPLEWEPQYNLTPVAFGDAQVVPNSQQSDVARDKSKAKKAVAPNQKKKAEDFRKLKDEDGEAGPAQNDVVVPPPLRREKANAPG